MKKILLICLTLFCCVGCQTIKIEEKLILSIDGNMVEVACEDYDRDAHDNYQDEIVVMELNEEVEYFETYKETIIHADGTEEITEESNEITRETLEEIIELGNAYSYLEINEKNQIVKITLWGELIVYD